MVSNTKIESLISTLEKAYRGEMLSSSGPTIKVNEAVSAMAFFYEKIRNVIDYKEEHLLRRNAIERILNRKIKAEKKGEGIGEILIKELIWARYLKNDSIPENKIEKIEKTIKKYFWLIEKTEIREEEILEFLLSIASTEIERTLVFPYTTEAFIQLMHQLMRGKIEETSDVQIYLAVARALSRADKATLRFALFNSFFPGFTNSPSEEFLERVRQKLPAALREIEEQLNHPLGDKILRSMKGQTAPFLILRDIIEEDIPTASQRLSSPEKLEKEVARAASLRYQKARVKFNREATRAIIFIFFTKMLIALIIEAPFDLFLSQKVNFLPLIINLVFPPFLMFLVTTTIKLPGEENTQRILNVISQIVYQDKLSGTSILRKSDEKGRSLNIAFRIIYSLFFLLLFGLIFWLLIRLKFNIVSLSIFLFFLCVVSFFGFLIRDSVKELIVGKEKEGFSSPFIDLISLPFLRVGRWLSSKLSKINVVVFIFDFILEAPFKAFIQVFEEWIIFLREKREETVVRIP